MSKDGRSPFVQLREAALNARIFGFGGQPTGTDMSLPSNQERKTRELIQMGISKGILSSAGTFENRKVVALAMDRSSCKSIVTAASRIKWPGSEPITPQKAHASTGLSVEERVERSRKHGVHGWTGDPLKELSDMNNTSEQSNTSNPFAADDAGTENVLLMGHAAGLHCLKPKERGEELTATQIAKKYPEKSAELKDAIDAEKTIALAREVGLNCVRPAQ